MQAGQLTVLISDDLWLCIVDDETGMHKTRYEAYISVCIRCVYIQVGKNMPRSRNCCYNIDSPGKVINLLPGKGLGWCKSRRFGCAGYA